MDNRLPQAAWGTAACLAFLALVTFSFPNAAHASDWRQLPGATGFELYIDWSSVSVWNGYKKAWLKGEYPTPRPVPNGATLVAGSTGQYVEIIALWYFRCPARQTAIVQSNYYMPKGEYVAGFSGTVATARFDEVVPDTTGEAVLNLVCGKP